MYARHKVAVTRPCITERQKPTDGRTEFFLCRYQSCNLLRGVLIKSAISSLLFHGPPSPHICIHQHSIPRSGPMFIESNLNDKIALNSDVVATQDQLLDAFSMSLLIFRICIGIIIMSLGHFILRYRYPCITIHGLDSSISHVRDALQRCREEGISAMVWGRYEVDLWMYVRMPLSSDLPLLTQSHCT
jgi:hypothetical protein